ncbi:MAG: SCP2 sterol-binding domain-containing protein [Cyanobacteria bacterium REEB446]|jgi:putative sterol carrier protein|nr:SCP2 sterol-binding domain-containing protein [Cyanobacteria bacterium REEB446]
MATIGEVFEEMHKHFNPEGAAGIAATYQFNISGPEGGTWVFSIKDKECEFSSTPLSNPSVEIAMSDKDWISIREGRLNSQMAFMQGKLKVKGDMGLAMKLQNIFPIKA